ncbi:unnamed protein product [Ceratitis capitata]|uniref:(Mediterranean fruit fly) hypothetical protein n=1 Tax=Ceratitis capitata TaxID=7213 RepID=A0A811UG29_CERCA|nr:unnamed protein product [Ceratitis capitata]
MRRLVPCVAYANPKRVYRWHTKRPNNEESIQHLLATGRAKIKEGTLIITAVDRSDSGAFFCTATNSEGSETLEVLLHRNHCQHTTHHTDGKSRQNSKLEHIRITSITKEDKGMYQCIVKNDLESTQGTERWHHNSFINSSNKL